MKIVIGITYNGNRYLGWQAQGFKPTIQCFIKTAISKIANHEVNIFCAGRTDTGVHAIEQILHFETYKKYNVTNWVRGINSYLPFDISVSWAKETDSYFHARFSAVSRRYCYLIADDYQGNFSFLSKFLTYSSVKLNTCIMKSCAKFFLGTKDFSAFRSSKCQSRSPIRRVYHLKINKKKKLIILDIEANAFLHKMVRHIVGNLIELGKKNKQQFCLNQSFLNSKKDSGVEIAQPLGLYFFSAQYPIHI